MLECYAVGMANKRRVVALSESDRKELERLCRSGSASKSIVERARIILLASQGLAAEQIALAVGTSANSVRKWRQRFSAVGIEGLKDAPRSGAPRKLDPDKASEILKLTVERVPRGATHWSVRLMAKETGVSLRQVFNVWKAADLKPHRLKTFKISNDPNFAEKVVDVVGLYMSPPDNAMVLSVDEKTQVQALDRTQPMLQLRPGQVERQTHDYKRNGTLNLYAAFDILTGKVIARTTRQHRAKEFIAFLGQVDRSTPADLDLHLILDNSSTHKTPEVQVWLEGHPRFHLHFTPTSASWLNAVERWFSTLETRALYRGTFSSVKDLRDAIHRYVETHSAEWANPLVWTKTAEVILGAVDRARAALNQQDNSDSGH